MHRSLIPCFLRYKNIARELRDAGDEDELQVVVQLLQRAEQVLEATLDGSGHLVIPDAVEKKPN